MASVSGVHTAIAARIGGVLFGFDAGYNLEELSRAKCLFVSHGHIDHVGALPLIVSRRGLVGIKSPAVVYAPTVCVAHIEAIMASYRAMSELPLPCEVRGVEPGQVVDVGRGIEVEVVGTEHRVPSVGFVAWLTRRQLRPELAGLSGEEIGARKRAGEEVRESLRQAAFAYTGDTQVSGVLASPSFLRARLLVCECTYVADQSGDDSAAAAARKAAERGHLGGSDAARIVEAASGVVVFMHFSARHSPGAIRHGLTSVIPAELRRRVWVHMGPS